MRCSNCSVENREGRKLCSECGTPLKTQCQSCGAANEPGEKFCGECGKPLASLAQADPTESPSAKVSPAEIRVTSLQSGSSTTIDGERKTVTALFADIKGSTELMADLDPEEARAIIDPALKIMIDAVRRYDGYVVQSTGDGIFALFGAPVAHEDHPQRALYAALRLQEELKRYSAKVVAEGSSPIQGRVGINTGEVVVRSIHTGAGQTEYTPIGHTTNLASRMQTAAPVGSIAVSDITQKLCEGYFVLKPLGATKVKGVGEPVSMYEVTGLGPLRTRLQRAAGRGLTKFVGREREMDVLKHAIDQACDGYGQIVAAMGDPGVGKSRLLFEFKAKNQSGWMVLETFSISHGKASAYLPVLDLLQGYFKIVGDDDQRTRREKVAGRLSILDPSLEDTRPYLFSLLGIVEGDDPLAQMGGQIKRRRTLEAIKRILVCESLNQPVMAIFEDLHWIDEATQEFLDLLADSIGTAKILLLVNYRPEYSHQWNDKTYYKQLRLDPLGKESAEAMLTSLLGNGKDLIPLKRLIIERTEGTPFFMEEIVQSLFEDGALQQDGRVKLSKSMSRVKVPATVQGVIAARIDRLSAEDKELLQTLAVLGREFPFALVRSVVTKSDDDLNRVLGDLQLGEFIYEQPVAGDTEYIFKHALTQEVAYNSVLSERRQLLHERAGGALESLYADRIDDHVAQLARHYARSAHPTKALEYCMRACQQSSDRASYSEAIGYWDTGLARLQEVRDDNQRAELELDLRNAVYRALITLRGYGSPEGEQSAERALELSRHPGIDWKKSWMALSGLWLTNLFRANTRKAGDVATRMLEIAGEHSDKELTAQSLYPVASSQMFIGQFESADKSFERAISLYETISIKSSDVSSRRNVIRANTSGAGFWTAYGFSAWNTWVLGFPNRAARNLDSSFSIARALNSKAVDESVHTYATIFFSLVRELEKMEQHALTLMTSATELGNPFRRALGELYLGWFDAVGRAPSEGVARMQRALADVAATGSLTMMSHFLSLIAQSQGSFGRYEQALVGIGEALVLIEDTGERFFEAEVLRTRGELLFAQGGKSNVMIAEQSFRKAIEVARSQKARSWELRAITSFARLMRDTGSRDEARSMLAEIYNWFTEGFDTADLKDAKSLLDDLQRQGSN